MSSPYKNGQISQRTGFVVDHTGLFVSWEKSHVLIHTIQDILRNKYKIFAKVGIRLPNNTAEIILYSTQSSGANIRGAKHLIEIYLKMIKESRPNLLIEKKVEVIELDVDESIPCINLDDSESESTKQGDNSTREVNNKSQENNSSVIDVSNNSSESNQDKRGLKRKHSSVDDVIEILDDEVIILEDSFSSRTHKNFNNSGVGNCNGLIDLTENNKSVINVAESSNKAHKIHKFHNISNGSCVLSPASAELSTPQTSSKYVNKYQAIESPSTSAGSHERLMDLTETNSPLRNGDGYNKTNQTSTQHSSSNISSSPFLTQTAAKKDNKSVTTESTKPSSEAATNKVSKLKYKRPAHLMVPLTISSNNSSTVDSLSNIYNPHSGSEEKKTGLRPIVIDGNNVAIGHGKGVFSMKGLEICINYFEKRGHRQIKAFVPHYRTNRDTFEGLRRLEKQGTVVVTPSRKVDGKVVASYDDRFIVQYASEFGGIIVSSDNFRDLLMENPSWKETIERRLLMFTWVDDLLMFPQDPLGRNGPTLDEFLKFPD